MLVSHSFMAVGLVMANYQGAKLCFRSTLSSDLNDNMLCMEMERIDGNNNGNVADQI